MKSDWFRTPEAQLIANECRETLELAHLLHDAVIEGDAAMEELKSLPALGSFRIPEDLAALAIRDRRHAELAELTSNLPIRQLALGRAIIDRLRILSLVFYPNLDGLADDVKALRQARPEDSRQHRANRRPCR